MVRVSSPGVFESLYYPELDSTNEEARRRLMTNELKTPLIIRAGSQSAGRGSHGRSWLSPVGMGLYFSIVHPQPGILSLKAPGHRQKQSLNPDWALCTRVAGLACAQVLREETGLQIQLKPINDLYIQSRKLGGILCESIFGQQDSSAPNQLPLASESLPGHSTLPPCRGLITGIGINLRQSEAVEAFCRTEQRPAVFQSAEPQPATVTGANQPISLQECLPAAVFSQWLDQREHLMQEQLVQAFAERVDALYQRLFWEEGYGETLLAETATIQFSP